MPRLTRVTSLTAGCLPLQAYVCQSRRTRSQVQVLTFARSSLWHIWHVYMHVAFSQYHTDAVMIYSAHQATTPAWLCAVWDARPSTAASDLVLTGWTHLAVTNTTFALPLCPSPSPQSQPRPHSHDSGQLLQRAFWVSGPWSGPASTLHVGSSDGEASAHKKILLKPRIPRLENYFKNNF